MTYLVISNVIDFPVSCYVYTSAKKIEFMAFRGGFRRFLYEAYDEKNVKEIDGNKVLSIQEFDKWLMANNMD